MRISGLGSTWPTSVPDSATCGVNPCTWTDNLESGFASSDPNTDPCTVFMKCALPNDPTTIAMTQGMWAGMASAAGQDTGAMVGAVASNLTSGLGTGLLSSTTFPGWLLFAGLAIGGLLLLKELR